MHTYTFTCKWAAATRAVSHGVPMGWLRLVGSIKWKVSFAECRSLLYGSFAKETYNFKEPTNRGHPIAAGAEGAVNIHSICVYYVCVWICMCVSMCVCRVSRSVRIAICVSHTYLPIAICVSRCASRHTSRDTHIYRLCVIYLISTYVIHTYLEICLSYLEICVSRHT